jgi:hypothetical protein
MRDSPVPTDLPTIGDRLSAWLGIGPTHAEVEAVAHDLILRHGVWAHDEAIHLSEVARFIGSARNAKLLPACGRSNKALVRGCVGKHSPKANQRGRPVTDRSGISEVFVNPRANVRCHGFSLLNEPQRIFLLDRSNPLLEISFECMYLLQALARRNLARARRTISSRSRRICSTSASKVAIDECSRPTTKSRLI